MEKLHSFKYHSYSSIDELSAAAARTLTAAIGATGLAYAPYSKLQVGAAVLLENDVLLKGANQENAAFPSGICAERSVLAMAANQYPGTTVCILAVSYKGTDDLKDFVITPCGQCRQVIAETAKRYNNPIKIIMSSVNGKILIVDNNFDLLPLSFSL